jgi:hypothetical protein
MIRQMTLSTTSSIAPEEAWSAMILGTAPEEEARPAVIFGTTKRWCFHVFTLDLFVYMDLWSCLWMLCCVRMWWILWSLNEGDGYCDVWINVLNLDLYMNVLYIVCAICVALNSSYWLYYFLQKKIIAKGNLRRLRINYSRLVSVIYVG